jgi:hypothetical protein
VVPSGKQRRRSKPLPELTPDVRDGIVALLSNPKTGPGTRAAYLCRRFPSYLGISPRARLLYVLLAGFIGADHKTTGTICVSMRKLAEWLQCSPRAAQNAVRELVRSGPFPLLTSLPGRQGRASEYGFVCNPFALADRQELDAQRTRERRQSRTSADRNAVMIEQYSRGTLAAEDAARKLAAISRRQEWNLPTRQVPFRSHE